MRSDPGQALGAALRGGFARCRRGLPAAPRRRLPTLVVACATALLLQQTALAAPTSAAPASGAAGGEGAPAAPSGGAGDFLGQLSGGSSKEPITIAANQLDFDYQQNRVTYRGNVRAAQGDLVIDSDTLTVTFDRAEDQRQPQLREVIAQGNVVITQGTRRATGGTAVFSQQKRQVLLLQDPVLRDGPNEVTGDRIIVYLDEGRSVVESSPSKRVSAVLYPGSEDGLGLPEQGDAPAARSPAQPGAPAAAEGRP